MRCPNCETMVMPSDRVCPSCRTPNARCGQSDSEEYRSMPGFTAALPVLATGVCSVMFPPYTPSTGEFLVERAVLIGVVGGVGTGLGLLFDRMLGIVRKIN